MIPMREKSASFYGALTPGRRRPSPRRDPDLSDGYLERPAYGFADAVGKAER
jgi:hypothetical protein